MHIVGKNKNKHSGLFVKIFEAFTSAVLLSGWTEAYEKNTYNKQ